MLSQPGIYQCATDKTWLRPCSKALARAILPRKSDGSSSPRPLPLKRIRTETELKHAREKTAFNDALRPVDHNRRPQSARAPRSAATEEVLHTFMGVTQRGASPQGSLIADAAGNLYGTTLREAERMAMARSLRSLRAPRASGGKASSTASRMAATALIRSPGLVFDAAGNLFGSCQSGSVFELSPSSKGWTITTLYLFGTTEGDGSSPNGEPSLRYEREICSAPQRWALTKIRFLAPFSS